MSYYSLFFLRKKRTEPYILSQPANLHIFLLTWSWKKAGWDLLKLTVRSNKKEQPQPTSEKLQDNEWETAESIWRGKRDFCRIPAASWHVWWRSLAGEAASLCASSHMNPNYCSPSGGLLVPWQHLASTSQHQFWSISTLNLILWCIIKYLWAFPVAQW